MSGELLGMPVIFLENSKNGDLCRFVPCQRGNRFVFDEEGVVHEVDDTTLFLFRPEQFGMSPLGTRYTHLLKDNIAYYKILIDPLESHIKTTRLTVPVTIHSERNELDKRLKERKTTILAQVTARNDRTLSECDDQKEQKKPEIQEDSVVNAKKDETIVEKPEDRKEEKAGIKPEIEGDSATSPEVIKIHPLPLSRSSHTTSRDTVFPLESEMRLLPGSLGDSSMSLQRPKQTTSTSCCWPFLSCCFPTKDKNK